jgi:hypothetical protein
MAKSLCETLKSIKGLMKRTETEIKGYHLVNETPIKETRWEDINVSIVSPYCEISDVAKGNHKSGKDHSCIGFGISNKSATVSKKGIVNVSSYRLTSVCSNKKPGDIRRIRAEIAKRDSSYSYYSLLIRDEAVKPKRRRRKSRLAGVVPLLLLRFLCLPNCGSSFT